MRGSRQFAESGGRADPASVRQLAERPLAHCPGLRVPHGARGHGVGTLLRWLRARCRRRQDIASRRSRPRVGRSKGWVDRSSASFSTGNAVGRHGGARSSASGGRATRRYRPVRAIGWPGGTMAATSLHAGQDRRLRRTFGRRPDPCRQHAVSPGSGLCADVRRGARAPSRRPVDAGRLPRDRRDTPPS